LWRPLSQGESIAPVMRRPAKGSLNNSKALARQMDTLNRPIGSIQMLASLKGPDKDRLLPRANTRFRLRLLEYFKCARQTPGRKSTFSDLEKPRILHQSDESRQFVVPEKMRHAPRIPSVSNFHSPQTPLESESVKSPYFMVCRSLDSSGVWGVIDSFPHADPRP
jgi:hypothetical protein